MDDSRVIYLALPGYGGAQPEMVMSLSQAIATTGTKIVARTSSFSLLAHSFNTLWCDALNLREKYGLTHFAMLHNDVAPDGNWLRILLDELERTGAELLSAVVPIKDDRGLTSTMHKKMEDGEEGLRLTLDDLDKLPVSFDASFFPGEILCVNSGCWICDLRAPWVEKVWFEIIDRIMVIDGQFTAMTFSEDWNFSKQIAELGGKVWATQILTLSHVGRNAWKLTGKPERDNAKQ